MKSHAMRIQFWAMLAFVAPAVLFTPSSAVARQLRPTIEAGIGRIQAYHVTPTTYAYPEIQVTSEIVALPYAAAALDASLYVGGWLDGVDRPSNDADAGPTYSFPSLIAGTRIHLHIYRSFLDVFAGFSRHMLWANYVGGTDLLGHPGRDFRDGKTAFEKGIRMHIPVGGDFSIGGGLHLYTLLPRNENSPYESRWAYVLSVSYGR